MKMCKARKKVLGTVKDWIVYGMTLGVMLPAANRAQSNPRDTVSAPRYSIPGSARQMPMYAVNFWVTAPIILVGGIGTYTWLTFPKSRITDSELAAIDPMNVPAFDRISLRQNIALVPEWELFAHIGQAVGGAMPLALLFDRSIRANWFQVLLTGLEANMAELAIYTLTPLGPRFHTRYRPLVYYPDAADYGIDRGEGYNKDSFYSGHVASVAASAFFMARVYSDYHPTASKTLLYGGAAIPALAMGLVRVMTLDHFPSDILAGLVIGTACGILVPQIHRFPP